MEFLIGVIILIVFVIGIIFYIKKSIKNFNNKYLGGYNLGDIIKEARIQDEDIPKSLSSMDRVYLEQIKKDFPELNINELKRLCEKEIIECYRAIENRDVSKIKNSKVKAFVLNTIDDLEESVKYNDLKIHNTVVSKYTKDRGVATIYFSTAFQYRLVKGSSEKKIQDRVRCECIYVIDHSKVEDASIKALGLNCPNCGSPIKSLGSKSCAYCGSGIIDIVNRVWIINDIVRY